MDEYGMLLMKGLELGIGSLLTAFFLWLADKMLKYDAKFWVLFVAAFVAGMVAEIPIAGTYLQWLVFLGITCHLGKMMAMDAAWLAIIAFGIKMGLMIVALSVIATLQDNLDPDSAEHSFVTRLLGEPPIDEDDLKLPPYYEEGMEEYEKIMDSVNMTLEKQYEADNARRERAQRLLESTGEPSTPTTQESPPTVKAPIEEQKDEQKKKWTSFSSRATGGYQSTADFAPEEIMERFPLSGIVTKGDSRFAIINGVVYGVGDTLLKGFKISRIEEEVIEITDGKNVYRMEM